MSETRGLYGEIRANKARSWLLASTLALVLGIFGGVWGAAYGDPLSGLILALVVATVLLALAWFGGSSATLAAGSARRADPERDRVLINVVNEMAIASGLPQPAVFVIDDSAPNAFATGRDPDHAAVAITRGLFEKLDRDELQAVIAHELAHIRNYDVRYMTFVVVTVGAIVLLADFVLRHLCRRFNGNDTEKPVLNFHPLDRDRCHWIG